MEAIIEAMFADTLILHYRPLADVQAGAIAGFDLHAVATGPGQPPVDYSTFVQAIERDGRAAEVLDRLVAAVCADLGSLADAGLRILPVTVQMPHAVIADPAFPDRAAAILAERRVPAYGVRIGITQAVAARPDGAAALARLKEYGLPLVLLDFDVETASLKLFGYGVFDAVEVGLRGFGEVSRYGSALLVATAGVAHAADMRVVARNVDDEARFDLARHGACDYVQGALLGPAVQSGGLVDYVREQQRLPRHVTEQQQAPRNLLLVDDEANIVSSLKRLLRRDSYTIHTAGSGQEGLDILAKHPIDVIVSDQRMPGMTGVEFLRQAKQLYPDTTRIVLSGYSELQSVVAAVNEGAVYKFLMKPWDDQQLREHILEAFRRKEMGDENRRLDARLKQLNSELSATNRRLEEVLVQQEQRIRFGEVSLDVAREALDLIPVPVVALDDEMVVAYMNGAAMALHADGAALLGSDAWESLPALAAAVQAGAAQADALVEFGAHHCRIVVRDMGNASRSRGKVVTLFEGTKG